MREPYVGEGADGCRRSAQIDREEADCLPTGPHQPGWSEQSEDRRSQLLASAAAWEEQAVAIESSMPDDVAGAIARVSGFIEAWKRLKRDGMHTDVIYSVGAFPDEDDPRELRQGDVEALLSVAGYALTTIGRFDLPDTTTNVEDDRVSDAATGLPPLEQVVPADTILLAAFAASVGVAVSPATGKAIPVRFLSVRGLVNAPEGDGHRVEWGQVHVAVPVEHSLDVAAALAKGTIEELGG